MEAVKHITAAEFEQFINLPENADRLFELIGGEIIEVPSNPLSSYIGSIILSMLMHFVLQHDLGYVTGEQGGYMVAGERYAPDAAYISKERQPDLPATGYCPNAPDLAVEVVSPSDTEKRLTIKVMNYLLAGAMVWVVYPADQEVVVYRSGEPARIIGIDGTLTGDDVLPGFELAVKSIFPTKASSLQE